MRFAERHAWRVFVALGLLYIAFGVSDISIAVTFVSRQLAIALIVMGVFQTMVSGTALRGGQRWAWVAMWVWPIYLLADALVLANEPSRGIGYAAFNASFAALLGLALLLSRRRYLSPG